MQHFGHTLAALSDPAITRFDQVRLRPSAGLSCSSMRRLAARIAAIGTASAKKNAGFYASIGILFQYRQRMFQKKRRLTRGVRVQRR